MSRAHPSEGGPAPTVSVIMPVYRTGALAVRAVESALNDQGVDLEVVAVDDASGDGTVELLRSIRDPRLRVVELPQNGGPSVARNRALDLARGEFVTFLDSDDVFEPGRCARLVGMARSTGAELVADDLKFVPHGESVPSGTLFRGRIRNATWIDAATFLRFNHPERTWLALGLCQPLIRRHHIETHGLRFDERTRYTEDFSYYVRCLVAGGRLLLIPDALYRYTLDRPGAATGTDRVELARRSIDAHLALERALGAADDAIRAELASRRRALERSLSLQLVLQPLRQRAWRQATVALVEHPIALGAVARRVGGRVWLGLRGREPGART